MQNTLIKLPDSGLGVHLNVQVDQYDEQPNNDFNEGQSAIINEHLEENEDVDGKIGEDTAQISPTGFNQSQASPQPVFSPGDDSMRQSPGFLQQTSNQHPSSMVSAIEYENRVTGVGLENTND